MTTYTVSPIDKAVAMYKVMDNSTAEVGRLKLGQSATGTIANGDWLKVTTTGGITGWLEAKNCRVVISEPVPAPPPPPDPDPVPVNTTLSFYVEIDDITHAWTYAAINGQEVVLKVPPPTAG